MHAFVPVFGEANHRPNAPVTTALCRDAAPPQAAGAAPGTPLPLWEGASGKSGGGGGVFHVALCAELPPAGDGEDGQAAAALRALEGTPFFSNYGEKGNRSARGEGMCWTVSRLAAAGARWRWTHSRRALTHVGARRGGAGSSWHSTASSWRATPTTSCS